LFDGGGSSSGVLLYGPPGCGKTLLVKALASTARIPCLVVTPSVLLRKYYGETNAQVRSLFSLAAKLSPCILCIDELDGLFRERSEQEHEVSRDLKTEFLQWVDGMMSKDDANRQILLVGATNRPFDCVSTMVVLLFACLLILLYRLTICAYFFMGEGFSGFTENVTVALCRVAGPHGSLRISQTCATIRPDHQRF
jgi:hypothetical protein